MSFENLTMNDGTVYSGVLGHFTVIDSPGPDEDLGGGRMLPLASVDDAAGHLKEALSNGFELLKLNLRPGMHHIKRA